MKHYICTGGCKGVTDVTGTCQTADCPDYGKDLHGCTCADGDHHESHHNEEETPPTTDK